MGLGIPTYVCASASVPMALALMVKGVSPGAVMVFLITGPASNAASITTLWKILGPRATVLYLLTVAGTALGAGFSLDYIFSRSVLPIAQHIHNHEMLPEFVKTMGAVTLLALLAAAILQEYWQSRRRFKLDRSSQAIILKVTGMACTECTESVRNAILACGGVTDAEVSLHSGLAMVKGENLDMECMQRAIRQLGFSVTVNKA